MQGKPSSNVSAFYAAGLLALAYYFAPDADADHTQKFHGTVLSGMFGFCAFVCAVEAWKASEPRPSPWPSLGGKLLWFLRPRGWMVAWAVIIAYVNVYGTPHLVYEYPPRTAYGTCVYIGAKGAVPVHHQGETCAWFAWL